MKIENLCEEYKNQGGWGYEENDGKEIGCAKWYTY